MTRGFSLVEVVISLFIIGVTIMLASEMLTLMSLSRHAKDQALALSIARNEISTLRAAGYDTLPASGSFSDTQLSSLPNGTGALSVVDYNDQTKQISATVSWLESNATSSVSMTTLVTKTGGL
ncbi:MAG: type IV pilus modification PilV family protein [Bacillota bacterium]